MDAAARSRGTWKGPCTRSRNPVNHCWKNIRTSSIPRRRSSDSTDRRGRHGHASPTRGPAQANAQPPCGQRGRRAGRGAAGQARCKHDGVVPGRVNPVREATRGRLPAAESPAGERGRAVGRRVSTSAGPRTRARPREMPPRLRPSPSLCKPVLSSSCAIASSAWQIRRGFRRRAAAVGGRGP